MADKQSLEKRSNRKQQRLAEQNRRQRMKWVRILGFFGIVILAAGALFVWRSANRETAREVAVIEPNRIGSEDAPVQIVEYGDFGCHACRSWHNAGIKDQLMEEFGDQISIEFRHFPVITRQSPLAAEASQCAAEQDAFWAFHDYIYEWTIDGALSRDDLEFYAQTLELDVEAFKSCLDSGRFRDVVQQDLQAAQKAGARGTPTFLINGEQVFPSYLSMSATIQEILVR